MKRLVTSMAIRGMRRRTRLRLAASTSGLVSAVSTYTVAVTAAPTQVQVHITPDVFISEMQTNGVPATPKAGGVAGTP